MTSDKIFFYFFSKINKKFLKEIKKRKYSRIFEIVFHIKKDFSAEKKDLKKRKEIHFFI